MKTKGFSYALAAVLVFQAANSEGQIITHPPPGWPPPPHPPVDHQPPPPKPKVTVQHAADLSEPLLLVPQSVPLPKGPVVIDTADSNSVEQSQTVTAAQGPIITHPPPGWPPPPHPPVDHQPPPSKPKVKVKHVPGLLKPLLLVPESMPVPDGSVVIVPDTATGGTAKAKKQ